MRLFQVTPDGEIVREIKSGEGLAGVYDGVQLARNIGGDGRYFVDSGSGHYFDFSVKDGQPHGLTDDNWKPGTVGDRYDAGQMAQDVSRQTSRHGGFFLDPDAEMEENPNHILAIPEPPAPAEADEEAPAEDAPTEEAPAEEDAEAAAEEAPAEEAAAEEDAEAPAEEKDEEDEEETGAAAEAADAPEE